MKNTSALFIIDDVIANQLLELDDEYIGYQVLHEESFYKRLFPCQLYADGAYGEDTIIQNLSCAERLLIRAVQEQKYVMFYC